jgi:glycosyltransferase involved in cell wall biosynthesis
MHVVHVPRRFVTSHWGGTETVILETSRRLLAMGHRTKILCPNALADRNDDLIDGVAVKRVPYFYPYWGLTAEARRQMDHKGGNLFSFALLRALQKEPALDIIHLHTLKRTGGIGRYAAMKRGIPYVVSLHGGVFDVPQAEAQAMTAPTRGAIEWGKLLGWWVGSRRVLDDAAAIVCVGEQERQEIRKRYPYKRVVLLPNGVDPDRFARGDRAAFRAAHRIPAGSPLLLTVGRIDPQKNQMLAVRVLAELCRTVPDVHLALVGPVTSEPYHDRLAVAIRDLALERQVTVIPGLAAGSQALADAYHAADIFLLPSVHEPFGIVILEAWAAGLPVAASRVGGIPSFVEEDADALLFPPDDLNACLGTLRTLLENPDRRRALADAGHRKACTQYTWDRITADLVRLYEEVRKDPSPG